MTIRKVRGGYKLTSRSGDRDFGTYKTKKLAEKRERQVQYFKQRKRKK